MLHIGGMFTALIIAVIFMLFLNGDIGWALIYILGGTAIVSAVLFLISRRNISVQLSELSGTVEYGRRVDVDIILRKTGFCVMPFIELCINIGANGLPIRIRASLIFGKEKRVSTSFRALHSGLNRVELTEAVLYDFIGMARGHIKLGQSTQKAVLPRIIEYDGPEILPNMLPSEEEEIEEGVTVMNGGMPGYEHREYVPGDSPRRVNYKLSAKKNKLMVRLDESQGSKSTNLCIADNAMPICCDKAFALASRLVIRGGTVKIAHKGEERSASTPETLERMREWLAFREYAERPDQAARDVPPPDTSVVFSGGGIITQISAI